MFSSMDPRVESTPNGVSHEADSTPLGSIGKTTSYKRDSRDMGATEPSRNQRSYLYLFSVIYVYEDSY